ncbi:MAG: hypothetical protein Q9M45_08715 [Robiginitomaculum sp.]|nr:hypothetical protein [Robiginitomaculum sp.]
MKQAITQIREELKVQLKWLYDNGKLLEAQRLEQRTMFDLEMLEASGVCAGIENYSRFLTGRKRGEPPPPPCLNICPIMRWCLSMKAMSACRNWGPCIRAIIDASPHWPIMAFACLPAWITGP